MQRLSQKLLERNLFAAEDAEVSGKFVTSAPIGVEPEYFDKFLRLLGAKSVTETEDITDDELLQMLVDGADLFTKISFGSFFDSSLFNSLSCQKSQMQMRRIL